MSFDNVKVRVAKRTREAVDIDSYELISADGSPLPAFSAGSHIDVQLRDGLTRQYSLCNDPGETHRYQIAVLKDPNTRGGSKHMHESVNAGDDLTISKPKNHFPLAHEARSSLLLAGGIGITPMLCMAERLANVGALFDMHYCARSQDRTAFVDRIRQSSFAANVQFHFDDGAPEQRLDLSRLLASPQDGVHLYVCGPKGFMDAVLGSARSAGWPEAQLHYEYFGAGPTASASDDTFEVKVASSGRIVVVPKDKSVVQALGEAGIQIPVSCEQGVCGTCLTRVLSGVPDHRDMFLSPREQARNDNFLPCCSRSKSPQLVIDL
jgi:vanillate O-demethylase ferredoxin subunit